MPVLVTGVAGFIGSHVARALLTRGETVIGVDNFSDYYDPVLKFARLKPLREDKGFTFLEADIADRDTMLALPERHSGLDRIVHLAAQPGVRHSLVDPYVYVQTNVMGQLVMLELARRCEGLFEPAVPALGASTTTLRLASSLASVIAWEITCCASGVRPDWPTSK